MGEATLAILMLRFRLFTPVSVGITGYIRDAGVSPSPARCVLQRVQHVCRGISESVHKSSAEQGTAVDGDPPSSRKFGLNSKTMFNRAAAEFRRY